MADEAKNQEPKKWEYIARCYGYWGRGKTLHEAIANLMKQTSGSNPLKREKGDLDAVMGHGGLWVDDMGAVHGEDLKRCDDLEVLSTWGEALDYEVTHCLDFLSNALVQFGVKINTDSVFMQIENQLLQAIRDKYPEDMFDGQYTSPPMPRLDVPPYIKECETEKLKTWYLNAKATCACGGHKKGQRNDELVALYTQELKDRDEDLPEGEGQFNGDGSS